MSGRNLRDFVFSHRSQNHDEGEKRHLMTRMMTGLSSDRYRKIDYDEAKLNAAKFRSVAKSSKVRLDEVRKHAKFGKERNWIRQHYPIWKSSYKELRDQLREAEFAYKTNFGNLLDTLSYLEYDEFADELSTYEQELDLDLKKFSQTVIAPVQQLITDLKVRLHNGVRDNDIVRQSLTEEGDNILEEVESVKSQCEPVTKWMSHHRKILEDDLAKCEIFDEKELPTIQPMERAIPVDVVLTECPDAELKRMIFKQFIELHENYSKRLREEETKYQASGLYMTQHDMDCWLFSTVYDLYHSHVPNHLQQTVHGLIIDMLSRIQPNFTKRDVFGLESHFFKKKYSKRQCEVLVSNYRRDFNNLFTTAMFAFAEAENTFIKANLIAKDREWQQKICVALHDKVTKLKLQQQEVMQLEAELEERKRIRELVDEEKKQWLENERRRKIKGDVYSYRRRKLQNERRLEQEKERRLEYLKSQIEQQREFNQERINYRAGRLKEKSEILAAREREKMEQQQQVAQRLENLRQTVAISAESDPSRLVADTIASKARIGIGADDEVAIQAPLYNVHGYSQKEIDKDVRVRVEVALRNAGMHQTEYAQKIIANLPPPTQPRRDNDSTAVTHIFKDHT